jgi:hypothetical protein
MYEADWINVATILGHRMLDSTEVFDMAGADLMGERASCLFAMALHALDMGQIEYADKLTEQAGDILDEATAADAKE